MGMAYMGLTHCEKCYKPLKDDEYVFCKKCEEENRKKDKSMKMKYKGYELLKAIADGEIKEGSKFEAEYETFIVRNGYLFVDYDNRQEYATSFELAWDFEPLKEKIDIESIKEMNLDVIDDVTYYINDLTKAVKYLDKRVKQLEEDK